ncbi:MAG: pyridoxal-phosphate-dependent aminotransferase family protein [Planctomycetota bacterium]
MAYKLLIPGPTIVSEETNSQLIKPLVSHRQEEFSELYSNLKRNLQKLFNTHNYVFFVTGSGTCSMEGAVRNVVKNKVLCFSNGEFGNRFIKISRANGLNVCSVELPYDQPITADLVDENIKRYNPEAITFVHSETSTGMANRLDEIAEVLKNYPDIISIVDAISSAGSYCIDIAKLGVDILIGASQKGFACPPGLSFIICSKKAVEKARAVPARGFYVDFLNLLAFDEKSQTPFTPAINLFYTLDFKVKKILEETIEVRHSRHKKMKEFVRSWARQYFTLFQKDENASDTITCICNTKNLNVKELNSYLRKRGFVISDGYGELKGKTFRIGHIGDTQLSDLQQCTQVIEDFMREKKII